MGLFRDFINESFGTKTETTNLAAGTGTGKKGINYASTIAPKTISQTRQDIKNWTDAQNMALKADDPKRWMIFNLYSNILIDLHLKSQINNRMLKSLAKPLVIKTLTGELDETTTNLLQNQKWVYDLNKAILETVYFGHSLGEFSYKPDGSLSFGIIPRQNIDPVNGLLYFDYTEDKKIKYREQKEYGSWLLEFGDPKDLGLLNGCVPHVLFKRFAESCWSELCEIYGIPPRVLKTNTQDRVMVQRGEKMLRDMGSAAWFIIDDSESFEWAKGVDTNGDVYKNLIALSNNEISMAVQGAVIGQDTKNGSNSKEQTSVGILQDLIDADLTLLEQYWNTTVIPALQSIGILPQNIVFGFDPTEDLGQLWTMTKEALPYFDVDAEWIKDKFGIEVTEKKAPVENQKLSLNIGPDFFV